MTSGSVECKYTLIIRIPKTGFGPQLEEILSDIRERMLIRFNETPILVDDKFTNKVV
jgi:hypothetical protein